MRVNERKNKNKTKNRLRYLILWEKLTLEIEKCETEE